MGIGSKLIDSSIWVAYFTKNKYVEIIEEETLFLSALSLFEIKKKFLKDKIPKNEVEHNIKFIKQKSIILPVTEEIAEKSAEISFEKNVPSADSIIYVTARENNAALITADNDFRGLEGVDVLD